MTAAASRRGRRAAAAPGNRPYRPDDQVPIAEIRAARAVLHQLAALEPDRHRGALLAQAVAVLDEAVRGAERRAARAAGMPAHVGVGELGRAPTAGEVAACRAVLRRMRDGGELLSSHEGACLLWALEVLDAQS